MLTVRPVFYASYRDIYDALMSSKLRVGIAFMHDFLRARGIILGNLSTRAELVSAIASYAYESADLDEICDQLEIHSKADRVTHMALDALVTPELIRDALDSVKESREGRTEIVDFTRGDGGRVEVSVNYYELDEGRTLLRQHRPKHGKIEFMVTGAGMRVRFPGAERVTEVATQLLNVIESKVPGLHQRSIDLSGFTKLQRTQFFQLLITKLDGYRTTDVRKVNVNQDIYGAEFTKDESDEPEDAEEEEEPDDDDAATRKEVEKEVKGYLKRCTLDGSGILHASELKRFLSSGFFISRIVWEAQPRAKRTLKPKAELEALLEHPAEGTGFKYTVRGVYSQKSNKRFASTKRRPKDIEREQLLDLMEQAAQAAYAEVAAEIADGAKK